ncbi:MAG: FAD-dependent thymidylate synthase [Clostridia bacterium]|nr:FAD-dependent thymidylate synthase [Clostridia bacterium]
MKIELIGGYEKNDLETRIQKVATAGKLSRFPGNVFEVLENCNDYEKNLKLIKRIIGMGHKSIIEHDYLVFAISDVTPIIEQTIIGNRLTSFTIKSRREVDFRTAGFYVPEFRDKSLKLHPKNEELKEKYVKHMKYLFNTYGDLVDNGINVEDSRFVLPYSFHSNIIMGLNARELEKIVISYLYGPLSKISEIKEFGNKLFDIIKQYVPYLEEIISNHEELDKNPFEYMESLADRPDIKIADKPVLLSYTPNPDEVILKSGIMYHFQCTEKQAEDILEKSRQKDSEYNNKSMDIILHKEDRRELEQVNFTFQIPISLSILTHLTRHRMHSLLVPEFLPMWDMNNFVVPATIKAKPELEKLYIAAHDTNMKVFEEFKELGIAEEDLIYFYLGCQMLNVVTTMNGRTLQWVLRMRCCNKAQWQIRAIAKELAKQAAEVAPLLGKGLGSTCMTDYVCYEGKECCGLVDKILEQKNK